MEDESVIKPVDLEFINALRDMSIQDFVLLMVELDKLTPPEEKKDDWRVW
jgi:hypothetical protein